MQYTLQHPHRHALRESLGLFERDLFVYSCPARMHLIAQKTARESLLVGLIGAVLCVQIQQHQLAPVFMRAQVHCAGVPWCGGVSRASPPLTPPGPLVASRSRGACARRVCVAARVLAGLAEARKN